ncbi:methionine--tRNA ligase [Patescibacteria group bacterium]|nr:methionine--tRNA ligase [Patescibacteria group bacterium]
MARRKVFIGVAWPYVNGTLHIGHFAGYLLPADISSRYHRLIGDDVLMVSGSDCFGTPITVEADKKGVSPKEIVDEYHGKDEQLFLHTLNLTYDLYTKTDHPNHVSVVQDIFIQMLEKDYIFVDTMEQYFSSKENRFLPDRYVVGKCPFCNFEDARSDQCDNCGKLLSQGELLNPRSNLSGEPVELKETEHYFADWPKLQLFLSQYVEEASYDWKEWVSSQTQAWLDEGLKPRAITRDLDWGVPLPKDRIPIDKQIKNMGSKRIYVWFDAVIGYLSASKLWAVFEGEKWEPYWYDDPSRELKHYYFMGKDNLVFHTLFWPGQLHVYDPNLHLPDVVSINMFLNLDGRQFSKSRGVIIDMEQFVKDYGNDTARFYLTLIMPEFRDSSFVWHDFVDKTNGILVANLGNFIHRVLSLQKAEKKEIFGNRELSKDIASYLDTSYVKITEAYEECRFRDALDVILELSQYGNKLIDKAALWKIRGSDSESYYKHLYDLNCIILALGYFMNPIMPEAAIKLLEMYSLECHVWPDGVHFALEIERKLSAAQIPGEPEPLFNKIEYPKELIKQEKELKQVRGEELEKLHLRSEEDVGVGAESEELGPGSVPDSGTASDGENNYPGKVGSA